MRTYMQNSPQAAGRVLAMIALADGHLSHDEVEKIDVPSLGLARAEWLALVRDYCEDLQVAAASGLAPLVLDERVALSLCDEVCDPALRNKVLAACESLVGANGTAMDAEPAILRALKSRWAATVVQ
jgi:hypothetical protein